MKKTVRIPIPANVGKLITLALNILAKHLDKGVNSPLRILNMAEMQVKTDVANEQHALAEKKSRDAETATEDRDLVLGDYKKGIAASTVLYYVTAVRDVLLGIYKGNEHHLGEWTFEVNTSTAGLRVVIPTHAIDLLTLAKGIWAKHQQDGANSPLNLLNMDDFQSKINEAESKYMLSKTLKQESEMFLQKRDLSLGFAREQTSYTPFTLLYFVSAVRDVLLGAYRGDERELGNWGFHVVTNLPAPASKKP